MMKRKAYSNVKILIDLTLVVEDIFVMIICGYHVFNARVFAETTHIRYYILGFAISFGVYAAERYIDEIGLIGSRGWALMLAGLIVALYGGSNVLFRPSYCSEAQRYSYIGLIIIGMAFYLYYDHKSYYLMEANEE